MIEVISPGSAIYDRNMKADTYEALGVRELWLIDEKAETIEDAAVDTGNGFDAGRIFRRGEEVVSLLFPDLHLQVEQLFAD